MVVSIFSPIIDISYSCNIFSPNVQTFNVCLGCQKIKKSNLSIIENLLLFVWQKNGFEDIIGGLRREAFREMNNLPDIFIINYKATKHDRKSNIKINFIESLSFLLLGFVIRQVFKDNTKHNIREY